MKKTLLAIAILGAAAMTAQAANVTLYGTVDAGFQFLNTKTNGTSTHSFKLADGLAGSNKVGIKGEEDLGNMKVGFKLENGFHVANGAMKTSGVLFDREARMYVKGGFGELAAGRIGGLASSSGSYDMFWSVADAFDGGDKVGTGFVMSDVYNNSLVYKTPTFGGFTAYADYSFSVKADQNDKFAQNDRYLGLGATFEQGPLAVSTAYELWMPHTKEANKASVTPEPKKPYAINLGASYKINDEWKILGGLQYAKNADITYVKGIDATEATVKSNVAGTLGAQFSTGNHSVKMAGYMARAKKEDKTKGTFWSLDGRYTYALSTRTSLFAGADYAQFKFKGAKKNSAATIYTGLHHNF